MVVAEQVKEPVCEVAIELRPDLPPLLARPPGGGVERDYHVAQERPIPRRLAQREREHVRRRVLPAPLAVEGPDAPIGDDQDRELRLIPAERGEVGGGAGAEAARGGAPARVLGGEPDGHGRETTWIAGGAGGSSPARAGYAGRVW